MSSLSPRQLFLLDLACKPVCEAFDGTPYLVGTAQDARSEGTQPRDVDVRLMLTDKAHRRLTKAVGQPGVAFLGHAVGQYLADITGLPIDFQIQQQTAANHHHPGKQRNPLGGRHLRDFAGDAELVDQAVAPERHPVIPEAERRPLGSLFRTGEGDQ